MIGDKIDALIKSVPEEAWDKVPENLAATIDSRLYGVDVDNAVREALERGVKAWQDEFHGGDNPFQEDVALDASQAVFTARLAELGFTVVRTADVGRVKLRRVERVPFVIEAE